MKWLERRTTDKDDLEARLIERKFGLVGYAIWEKLQQIIAEHMNGENMEEWGYVAKDETLETLVEKIHCSLEQLRDFVKFCDENTILEKRNGRLFCPYVLERQNDYAKKAVKNKANKGEKSGESEKEDNPEYPDNLDNTDKPNNPDNPKNPRNNTAQHNTAQHSTTPKIDISGGKRPETASVEGFSGIGSVLSGKRSEFSPSAVKGISKEWQFEAFECAKKLDIRLAEDDKSRWLKIFRQARVEGRKTANLEKAKSYLSDHPEWEAMDNIGRLNFFFSIYENGLEKKYEI
jgi:hypothetical protein